MKRTITYIIIIFSFIVFVAFVLSQNKSFEVIELKTPTQIVVDFNKNRIADADELICLNNVDAFSLGISEEFYDKYSKKLNLNRIDMMNLGYLADEYANKNLKLKKVNVKFSPKRNMYCHYADIIVENKNYGKMLLNSGFGINKNGEIGNIEKYKQNYESSKKLNLVLLNHHSNKYHTLDCEYGNQAHDIVIIPEKQLPSDAIPCRYCHKLEFIKKKKFNFDKNSVYNIVPINQNLLKETSGSIAIYHTDYTKHLKPDSGCETTVCKEFVKLVNSSSTSIDIAIYGYENIPQITKALENAKSRGVKIRFVYDEAPNPFQTFYKNNNIIADIADVSKSDKYSVEAAKLMHNKFIIFDNKIVYTGSMNFSPSGLSEFDINDVAIINSDLVARLYTMEFEQMLDGKFHNRKIKHNFDNKFIMGDSIVEVYFSPQYNSAQRLIQLINSAKTTIYMPTFLITHKDIANSLLLAHKRGVEVKIIMDANSLNTQNSKHQILRESGILLKTENYAGKLHSKGIVIDESYVVIGSMNFSNSGNNKNDENMIIIQNNRLAKNYKAYFNYLWKIIPDKYLKYNPLAEGKDSIGSCSDGVDNNFNGKTDSQDAGCK